MNNDEQRPKLTDEEVWLRAYCAAVSSDNSREDCLLIAEDTLERFKERFRQK